MEGYDEEIKDPEENRKRIVKVGKEDSLGCEAGGSELLEG